MTRTKYYTIAKINNKKLIAKITNSVFRYKGPYSYETYDELEDVCIRTDDIDDQFLDIAFLFGFRDTHYREEGDHPITNKELQWLNDITHRQIPVYPKMVTYDPSDSDYCTNEFRERLVRCDIGYDIDNKFEVTCDGVLFTGLFRALSIMFPGVEIRLQEYEYNDNGNSSDNYYIIKYGAIIESKHCEDNNNDKVPSDPHRLAVYYGQKGEYRKSLRMLKSLKTNSDIINDIGVNYERLGKYKKAYKYYKKANIVWSLVNVLRLYDNNKILFKLDDYQQVCKRLNELGSYHGYVRESNLYHYGRQGIDVDYELSTKIAREGYDRLPKEPNMIFQYAWCLAYSCKNELDKVRGHRLYKSIVYSNKRTDDEDLYESAMNNYAWHCLTAYGCSQNIPEAIYWFIRTFEHGYKDAAEQLAIIYSTCDDYQNKEIAHFWLSQLKKK